MKTLNVTLVNLGRVNQHSTAITPPIGLLYLAAYARRTLPLNFTVFDQRVTSSGLEDNVVVRRIVESSPDLVGFRCLTADAGLVDSISRDVKAALPKTVLVAGGPHPSAVGEELLKDTHLDIVVQGEGEVAFEMILRAMAEGSDFSHIPGLIWRNSKNEIVLNEGSIPIVEDLDNLPPPAYDLLDIDPYWRHKYIGLRNRRPYVGLFTSRGCPYRCNYCHSIFGKGFRAQSAERIADDIAHFKKICGVTHFDIWDDIFNLDKKRVLAFPDALRKRDLKPRFAFGNGVRTDILTQETVDALVDAGMYVSGFALESGSPRIQKLIGKNLDIDRYLAGVEMAAKRRVFTYGFVMLGFHTETLEEMKQTIDVACKSRLHAAVFFVVTPFPNTHLYNEVVKSSPEKLQNVNYETGDYIFNITANLSSVSNEELLAMKRTANQRFYLNPGRVARLIRDYPAGWKLLHYAPLVTRLLTKRFMR